MFLADSSISKLGQCAMDVYFAENFKELNEKFGCPYDHQGMVSPFNSEYVDDIAVELSIDKEVAIIGDDIGVGLSVTRFQNGVARDLVTSGQRVIDLSQFTHNSNKGITYALNVPPHTCILASSKERVQLPPDVMGLLSVRSSYARQFLNHMNSNIIQPTFCGDITFEFYTMNQTVDIYLEKPVVKMLLSKTEVPEVPYYARKTSKYMNQNNLLSSRLVCNSGK